ncbi:hypothetical protein [Nocardioides solisilvae]|uniref:hypothetical protein n=1 Tax=Nocardioides solisilvae TaxID=1542435 RepID=UPI0013A54FD0|nr:hypothetical protein [Nocardioides solisilvae]
MSGIWTTLDGLPRRVKGRYDLETVDLEPVRADAGAEVGAVVEVVPASRVGTVERVHVTAQWRGGEVVVSGEVAPGRIGFYTWDAGLAEREGLDGSRYRGWSGVADVADLGEVVEDVKVLREAGAP